MTKYTWVLVKINTENRDRKGGHHNTNHVSVDGCYSSEHGPEGIKFMKRKMRRKQRRQEARITAEALKNYYLDFYECEDILNTIEKLHEEELAFFNDYDQFYEEEDYLASDQDIDNYYNNYSQDNHEWFDDFPISAFR